MASQQTLISNNSDLITATIKPKEEIYYLVTKDTLGQVKEKSLFFEIFMLVSSLALGAFFSTIITIEVSTNIASETTNALSIYKWVFLGAWVLFCALAVFSFIAGRRILKSITVPEMQLEQTKSEKKDE